MQLQCDFSSVSAPFFLQKIGESQPDLTEGQWFRSYYFPIHFIKMNGCLDDTLVTSVREVQLCELKPD